MEAIVIFIGFVEKLLYGHPFLQQDIYILYVTFIFNFKCCRISNVSSEGEGMMTLLFYSASIYGTQIINH